MNLNWKKKGKGKKNIVLLHGWGLNKEIWNILNIEKDKNFLYHIVDLPGYGCNRNITPKSLEETENILWKNSPKKAIWLGWSLGGIFATSIAIKHQKDVSGLITVASSPCFIEHKNWPGINQDILKKFKKDLKENFKKTIERFLILQTLNKKKNKKKNMEILKLKLLKKPFPTNKILNLGLNILLQTDLRNKIKHFKKPFLRIYGKLDTLVPIEIIPIINKKIPQSESIIIKQAAHAPFLSHPKEFIKILSKFSENFN